MKRIFLSVILFLSTLMPAVAAETTDRAESIPDANPACMERNGPDCVLKSQVVPPRVAAPPGSVIPPADSTGVVVIPAPGTATAPGVVVVPAPGDTATIRGTANPQGLVGSPAAPPADSATMRGTGNPQGVSGSSAPAPASGATVITPSGQGSTVISPRR